MKFPFFVSDSVVYYIYRKFIKVSWNMKMPLDNTIYGPETLFFQCREKRKKEKKKKTEQKLQTIIW